MLILNGILVNRLAPPSKLLYHQQVKLAMVQLEDALTKGDKSNLSMKGVKKVADAAADDRQLTKSLQKFERDFIFITCKYNFIWTDMIYV